MTFNIRYATPLDGPNRWERRRESLVQVIESRMPDVVCCQEVSRVQRQYLESRLGSHYGFVGSGRNWDGGGEQTPILWRQDRLDVGEWWTFWLSSHPRRAGSRGWDAALPRTCTLARLRWKDRPERSLLVGNTHLDHKGRMARGESVTLLLDLMAQLAYPDQPRLLLGDFNAVEWEPPIQRLRQAFQDTYRRFAPHAGLREVGTFHAFLGPYFPLPPRLDYVFADSGAEVLECGLSRQRGRHRGYPSDHYPVWARLAW